MSIVTQLVDLLLGLLNSISVSAIAIVVGLLLGCAAGAARAARIPVLNRVLGGYVALFRCTPLIVQIFFLYAALPEIGITLDPFQTGWIALALWGGAYYTESFRAGFSSVPPDEVTAARALGMSGWQAFVAITLPLGVRVSIPSLTTTALAQFRSSSFLVAIGYAELTYAANLIVSETFQVFQVFGMAAALYLVICLLISAGSHVVERSARIPGLEVAR